MNRGVEMTVKELEQRVIELERQVQELQTRPIYVPMPYPVYPTPPIYPTYPAYPNPIWTTTGTNAAAGIML